MPSSYVVERMEICERTIFHLKEHVEDGMTSMDERNRYIVISYVQDMEYLLQRWPSSQRPDKNDKAKIS